MYNIWKNVVVVRILVVKGVIYVVVELVEKIIKLVI